jgi:hypothetical protein
VSLPHFVHQAYTNAAAHEEADEEWEDAQEFGYYDVASQEWDEEMVEQGEENEVEVEEE